MKFEIRKAKDKQWYSILIGDNGEDLMTSETYTKKRNCRDTIMTIVNSLRNCIPEINDLTKK